MARRGLSEMELVEIPCFQASSSLEIVVEWYHALPTLLMETDMQSDDGDDAAACVGDAVDVISSYLGVDVHYPTTLEPATMLEIVEGMSEQSALATAGAGYVVGITCTGEFTCGQLTMIEI